jgi:hypothetical protein
MTENLNGVWVSRWLFTLAVLVSSQSAYAYSASCQAQLTNLIVPSLQHVYMKKKDIRTELQDDTDGVYSVRLYVAADSPDNLDKAVTIGWINLDMNTMQVLDVTRDPDNPDVLKVVESRYRDFVSTCIPNPQKAE